MKILVIIAHPNFSNSKINKRWVEELKKHKKITIHDIYELYPDGIIDIKKEQKLLQKHDRIVFQFPLHWYSVPPLIRTWQDKVLEHGWAYGVEYGELYGKEFIVAVSVGAPKESYRAGGYNKFTLDEILRPLEATAGLLGMKYLPVFSVYSSVGLSEEEKDLSAVDYVNHIVDEDLNPELQLDKYRNTLAKYL